MRFLCYVPVSHLDEKKALDYIEEIKKSLWATGFFDPDKDKILFLPTDGADIRFERLD